MDEQYSLITQWFESLGIVVNLEKLKRQLSIIDRWFKSSCVGAVEAVTGFGKTYIAVIGIHRLNLKYPEATYQCNSAIYKVVSRLVGSHSKV